MSQTPENTGNMTTYPIRHMNVIRHLLNFLRRSENRQPTRFSPQRQSRRHEIFEPDSGNYKYIIPDKDFIRIAHEAHRRDITINRMINIMLKDALAGAEYRFEHGNTPQLLNETK